MRANFPFFFAGTRYVSTDEFADDACNLVGIIARKWRTAAAKWSLMIQVKKSSNEQTALEEKECLCINIDIRKAFRCCCCIYNISLDGKAVSLCILCGGPTFLAASTLANLPIWNWWVFLFCYFIVLLFTIFTRLKTDTFGFWSFLVLWNMSRVIIFPV